METVLLMSSALLWLILACNVLLTLALVRRLNRMGTNSSLEMGLKKGENAPDFAAQTLEGTTKTLADYTKQAVAFVFLSAGCKPCRDRLPMLEKTRPEAQASGIELVLVIGDSLEETQAWSEEMDIQLPILIAPRLENSFFDHYKVTGTPAFCLVDQEGKVSRSALLSGEFQEWKLLTRTKLPKGQNVVLAGN